MKIVTGVTYSYPYIGSGIGNVAMKQAEGLVNRGNKVTLISSNTPETNKEFTRNKVKYLKANPILRLEKIGLPIPLFLLTKGMKNAIKEADIVHIHDSLYPSSYQIARYARKYNKKIILTQHIGFVNYHNFIYRFISKAVYKTMSKKIFSWSEKVLMLNSKAKKELGSINLVSPSKLEILPNGVDTRLFKPASKKRINELRKKYNLPLDKPIILFVGRLVAVKAFERLFEAKDNDYLILFVGGGEIPKNMLNHPNAQFMGEQPQEKLSEFYQLSDLFCLPSKSEGFPLSVLEAMSSGLPVIVSNLEVYYEYFNEKEINIVNPKPKIIKSKIKSLLRNKSLMNMQKIKSRYFILKTYDWKNNIHNLTNIYKGKIK